MNTSIKTMFFLLRIRYEDNVLLLLLSVWLASFLKIWIDMYPHFVEIKYGTNLIRPKRYYSY